MLSRKGPATLYCAHTDEMLKGLPVEIELVLCTSVERLAARLT